MVEELFFELLRVAVGRQNSLSHTPTADEWRVLYGMAMKQAVSGVCFKGVERLHPQGQVPPQDLLFEWIGATEAIRATNELLNKRCRKLQAKLTEAGIRSSILKGQAVAKYYGDVLALYRQSGDIDIYVDCGMERAMQFAREQGVVDAAWDYKHLHLDVFKDTEVEMHYRVEVMLNLWKNRKLQRWFKEHEKQLFCRQEGLIAPQAEFNRFYILLHIYRHFLYEGVGMRQLMDYYFVLRHTESTDTSEITSALKEFGMMRFARGIMWVMQEVFALERQYMICEPLEREGRFILMEVMAGGNFGHHDERINKSRHSKIDTVKAICKHNWHLMQHYPSEVIWPPVWFVWHKCWKIRTRRKLRNIF